MKEERLRYLTEISHQRSISAAAKNLFLSQASLSTNLREAEKELGFPVFERTHNGITPTQEGKEALRLIEEINTYMEQIRELGTEDLQKMRRVSLIVSPSIAYSTLLPLMERYHKKQPHGPLSFQIKSGEYVVPKIIKNEFNIGLTYMKDDELLENTRLCARFSIRIEQLLHDHLCCLVRKDSPLAEKESIAIGKQMDTSFAILPHFNSSENAVFYVGFLNSANTYTVFPSVAHLKNAVREKNMVAVLPGFALHYDKIRSNDEFVIRPVSGLIYHGALHLCLVHRDKQELSRQERDVLECVRERFRK